MLKPGAPQPGAEDGVVPYVAGLSMKNGKFLQKVVGLV
jgi:hypothetical protein